MAVWFSLRAFFPGNGTYLPAAVREKSEADKIARVTCASESARNSSCFSGASSLR